MTPSDADLIAAGAKRVERIGDAVLVLGDCREIAPRLPRPDAIVSDPPYGMAHNTDSRRCCTRCPSRRVRRRRHSTIRWGR